MLIYEIPTLVSFMCVGPRDIGCTMDYYAFNSSIEQL